MDLYEGILEKQALMMEAYKDFRDLCDELKDERGLGNNDFEEYLNPKEEELEVPEESPWAMSLMSLLGPEPRGLDEFPEQKSISHDVWSINPEDPELAFGKSLGIPVGLVVRDCDGDDKLLPIVNGRFTSYGL